MRRKSIILILLFSSWFIANIHRGWNNIPVKDIYPFPCRPEDIVTLHWYVHFILKDISYIFIFLSFWLYVTSLLKRDKDIIISFGAIFAVQIIDFFHYILYARHNEYILTAQGLIMIGAALIIRLKKSSKVLSWIGL